MQVRLVDNKNDWDDILAKKEHSQFILSWSWGVFQQLVGRDVKRMQVVVDQAVVAAALAIKYSLPAGKTYWYVPRGPVWFDRRYSKNKIIEAFTNFLRLQNNDSLFVKYEPSEELEIDGVPTPTIQPQNEWAVKLYLSESELLGAMHEKTRYNIKLSEKKGVETLRITDVDYALRAMPRVSELIAATAKRQGITPHASSYYVEMIKSLLSGGEGSLFLANFENKIIAADIVVGFGDTLYYVHGASDQEHKTLMAPHLLHWRIMQYAKSAGYNYYNFGGVGPKENAQHPWAKLTRFKTGFGDDATGVWLNYPLAKDVVLSRGWYKLYKLSKKIKSYGKF